MTLPFRPDAETYAVLVVDMQKDGVEPGGAIFAPVPDAVRDDITRLVTAAREHGWPVLHSQHGHRPDGSDFGIAGHFEELSCVEGTPGIEFIAGMEPAPGEVVIRKRRYSAFHATDLEMILRQMGVTGLFVCGVLTDACVLSTVVDARARDFKVWAVRGALAGTTEELHESALAIYAGYFADVVDTDWAIAGITAGA
ncbi:cysteine hydrolase family protein [Ruania albidiflava]|uniref:cysteine hydrolase family protein n=1 Tax=Ruania albidiflava TaxID=366586 RepID=UPI0023F25052|nr:isochorismatase family cysteine hydrolase [Ruania albidiflava]